MKTAMRIVLGLALAAILGPAITIAAAEWAFWTPGTLAVPVWERGMEWVLMRGIQALVVFAGAGALASWRVRGQPFARGLALLAFVTIGTLSLLFSFVPIVNAFYSRYQPVISHATAWAAGYSEERFDAVAIGIEASRVIDVVGEPISRIPMNGKEAWTYSAIGHYERLNEKGFHQRLVAFENQRVAQVQKRYLTAEHVPF